MQTFFKHQMEPGVISRRKKRAATEAALREAYDEVNQREANICQVTGRYTIAGHPDPRARREHHHLRGRRVRPDWLTRSERILLVTAEVHRLITLGWIAVEGTDARKEIRFFWTESAKGPRPFEIKSRRQSQIEE